MAGAQLRRHDLSPPRLPCAPCGSCRPASRDATNSSGSAIRCSVQNRQNRPTRTEEPIKLADAGMTTMRGVPLKRRSSPKLEGVDSAELAMLPRLPDTAEELKSIALALQADPSEGPEAWQGRERSRRQDDGPLGLQGVGLCDAWPGAGRLNGLTQPAFALSAPAVAGVEGDGLLTMEEFCAQARRRLGRAVRLQHRCGRRSRRRSGIGTWPRLLLCRHARIAGDQLVGPFAIGARTRDGPFQTASR